MFVFARESRHWRQGGGVPDRRRSDAARHRHGTVVVSPNPDPLISLPLHQIALVIYGVHLLERESLKLDELAAKNVSEFAFMMQPLKLQGATGSTVAPAAIRWLFHKPRLLLHEAAAADTLAARRRRFVRLL